MAPLGGLLSGHVDQIALVVPDLEPAMRAYVGTLGVKFQCFEVDETKSRFSGNSPQFRIRIAVAWLGVSSIELIQPVSGVTLYSQHLQTRGPGLHHLGVYVDDLSAASRGLTQRGCQAILEGSIEGLGEFAYFDSPEMHCILEPLQLATTFPIFLAQNARWFPAD